LFDEIKDKAVERYRTGIMDRNFSGGDEMVEGQIGIPVDSVTLLAGKNGGGKSTIVLQAADEVCTRLNRECLLVLAEEGGTQVKNRVKRLPLKSRHLFRFSLKDSDSDLAEVIERRKPCIVIVDSLDGMSGGNDELSADLLKAFKMLADKHNCPFIVINHINKDDNFAGREALQHWVDITMTLFPVGEGDGDTRRELFTLKNRYSTAQVGTLLCMTAQGLVPGTTDRQFDDYDEEENEEDSADIREESLASGEDPEDAAS
jgi:DNA repair protein RadA/Sms